MTDITHFDRSTIDALPRRPYVNLHGPDVADWFRRVVTEGIERFVENAAGTTMEVVVVDDLCIPIVINPGQADSCYFVSPHGHYVRYAREEIRKTMPLDATTASFISVLSTLGALGKLTRFNRHVSVNNWLFSTNPPLALTTTQAAALIEHLTARFADYAVVVRTVNEWDIQTQSSWREAGCMLVPNRDLYFWYPERLATMTRSVKKRVRTDRQVLRQTYRRRPASCIADDQLAARLYRHLYCGKHSARNARLTPAYFTAQRQSGACDLEVFERDGQPLAIRTSLRGQRFLYGCFVGYDPAAAPKINRQYRSVVASLIEDSIQSNVPLFLSTGAASFKQGRGAVVGYEFEAVYTAHLPWWRQLPWRYVKAIYDRIFQSLDMDCI